MIRNTKFPFCLSFVRENDITPVLDHTFCVEHNAFGRILQHELKPNGRNIPVTEENKKEYVRYCRTNTYPAVTGRQRTRCVFYMVELMILGISEGNS